MLDYVENERKCKSDIECQINELRQDCKRLEQENSDKLAIIKKMEYDFNDNRATHLTHSTDNTKSGVSLMEYENRIKNFKTDHDDVIHLSNIQII